MRRKGYIPTEIHFYLRHEITFNRGTHPRLYKAHPAFPVASRSIGRGHKVAGKAERWANSLWGRDKGQDPLPVVVLPNIPKSGYRLVAVDTRTEGGRAWKVISPEGFYVDLREDVFLPLLLEKGLPADGMIDAEFQWCQNGSQLRLERVGSPAHNGYVAEADF